MLEDVIVSSVDKTLMFGGFCMVVCLVYDVIKQWLKE